MITLSWFYIIACQVDQGFERQLIKNKTKTHALPSTMPCSLTVRDRIMFSYNNLFHTLNRFNFNTVKRRQASLQKPFKYK